MTTPCPPYQGISLLCQNLDTCERTIDSWVEKGILPPPVMRGGKRMWKWKTVEAYMDGNLGQHATGFHALANWLAAHL